MRFFSKVSFAAIFTVFAGRSAGAQEANVAPLSDRVEVAESRCLDKAMLVRHVKMWLKRDTIDARLRVRAEDLPDGVRFVLSRDGAPVGERTLDVVGVPCQEIHAALGLGIAAAIDKTILAALAPESPPAPVEVALPPASSVPAPAPVPVAPAPFVASQRWSPAQRPIEPPPRRPFDGPTFTASVEGLVLINVLPEVTLGVAPSAEITVIRGFDLRASLFVTTDSTVALGEGTADTNLVAGRADACAAMVLLDDLARLRACGGLLAGAAFSRGTGFDDPRASTSPWVAPVARVDARWSLTPVFGLLLSVDGVIPGLVPELQVEDKDGEVIFAERFPIGGVTFGIGPSVTF
jgi:hypothetical protein